MASVLLATDNTAYVKFVSVKVDMPRYSIVNIRYIVIISFIYIKINGKK